jgi:hypothetical protein
MSHDVVEEGPYLARIVERDDVGMLESSGDLDLAEKSFGAQRRPELGMKDLDGNEAVVLEVAGEIDRGHPASPELALEAVAFG